MKKRAHFISLFHCFIPCVSSIKNIFVNQLKAILIKVAFSVLGIKNNCLMVKVLKNCCRGTKDLYVAPELPVEDPWSRFKKRNRMQWMTLLLAVLPFPHFCNSTTKPLPGLNLTCPQCNQKEARKWSTKAGLAFNTFNCANNRFQYVNNPNQNHCKIFQLT